MASGSSERPLEILLVEASPADARLAEETLKSSNHPTNITVAEDGEGALARLRKEGEYEGSPRPDLILPGMQGTEVLVEIAADPDLATIPVMILTGTEAEQSMLNDYNIHPNRYCRKPMSSENFHRVTAQLDYFSRQPSRISRGESQPAARSTAPAGQGKRWWWPFG